MVLEFPINSNQHLSWLKALGKPASLNRQWCCLMIAANPRLGTLLHPVPLNPHPHQLVRLFTHPSFHFPQHQERSATVSFSKSKDIFWSARSSRAFNKIHPVKIPSDDNLHMRKASKLESTWLQSKRVINCLNYQLPTSVQLIKQILSLPTPSISVL